MCHELHISRFKKSKVNFVVKRLSGNIQSCVKPLSALTALVSQMIWPDVFHPATTILFIHRTERPVACVTKSRYKTHGHRVNVGFGGSGQPVQVTTSLRWLLCLCRLSNDIFSTILYVYSVVVHCQGKHSGSRLLQCNPQPSICILCPLFLLRFVVNTIRVHHVGLRLRDELCVNN